MEAVPRYLMSNYLICIKFLWGLTFTPHNWYFTDAWELNFSPFPWGVWSACSPHLSISYFNLSVPKVLYHPPYTLMCKSGEYSLLIHNGCCICYCPVGAKGFHTLSTRCIGFELTSQCVCRQMEEKKDQHVCSKA